jgi:RNA ligase (TIGR02306 family)
MENLNSVCYVASINEIKPIEGADNIELAIINGWNCIVKKNTYNVGDLIVVATTDAIIPEKLSDNLGVTNYLRKGGRVKTIKLKGVYSECLIIPISFIPDKYHYEGSDCMELLEIFKYEPPVKQIQLASGKKIRYQDNPNFHVYYKFANIKNVPGMFTEEDIVEITRKIHGTSSRYGIVRKNKLSLWDKIKKFFKIADKWIDYEFIIGSHNVEKGSESQGFYDTNVWFEIEKKYDIKNKLWNYVKEINRDVDDIGEGIILYGEIYGAGIQKGYDYGLKEIKFAGFDIKKQGDYLSTDYSETLFKLILELPYVEVLYVGNWSQEIQNKFTFNNFIPGTKIPEEGIVIKHISGKREKIAKVINPDYLIYSEKHNVEDSH